MNRKLGFGSCSEKICCITKSVSWIPADATCAINSIAGVYGPAISPYPQTEPSNEHTCITEAAYACESNASWLRPSD